FFSWESERVSHLHANGMIVLGGWILICFEIMSHPVQLFRRIERVISVSVANQFFCVVAIVILSFALPVRSVVAAVQGAFIGFETCPLQAIENIFFSTGDITALIGVFDAENKIALVLFCKQIVI